MAATASTAYLRLPASKPSRYDLEQSFMRLDNIFLAIVVLLILAVLLATRFKLIPFALQLVRTLYLRRIPLLVGVILFAGPIASGLTKAHAFTEAFYDVQPWGVFFCVVAASVCAWTIMLTHWTTQSYGPQRFGTAGPAEPGRLNPSLGDYLFGFALTGPALVMISIVTYYSLREMCAAGAIPIAHAWRIGVLKLLAAVAAYALAAGLVRAAVALMAPNEPFRFLTGLDDALMRLVIAADGETHGAGYVVVDAQNRRSLGKGHRLAVRAFLISFAFYATLALSYWVAHLSSRIPTLTYIFLLLILLCWTLSGIAFFLDGHRVPVIVPLVLWATILSFFNTDDHFYHVIPIRASLQTATTAPATLRDTLVLVAASGGGIQSGAWTARVLQGLSETQSQFVDDLDLISSVSGGSVGAMFYSAALNRNSPGAGQTMDRIRYAARLAMQPSLSDVAWGLVYPDFWHSFLPFCIGNTCLDRGVTLEESWLRRLRESSLPGAQGHLTLSAWAEDVSAHRRPANLFNATIADTGQPFLLSTSDPDPSSDCDKPFSSCNFNKRYPFHDISIPTAARLSATFTYVSPATRADASPQFHVVDGGYYDDFGIVSLIAWLDNQLHANKSIRRVLIVQIRGSSSKVKANIKTRRGWLYQSFAPVATLLRVRETGQGYHNHRELCLLQQKWINEPEHKVAITSAEFEFPGEGPESWQLTDRQKAGIETAWRHIEKDDTCGSVRTFREFFDGHDQKTPCSTPVCSAQ